MPLSRPGIVWPSPGSDTRGEETPNASRAATPRTSIGLRSPGPGVDDRAYELSCLVPPTSRVHALELRRRPPTSVAPTANVADPRAVQRLRLECPDADDDGSTILVLGGHAALTSAKTAGVPLFRRCPPVHSIIIGRSRIEVHGRIETPRVIAIPASTPHTLLAFRDPHACVAYLDPRRFEFEHVQRLARRWRGFVPGRDELREAFGDTCKVPEHRVDRRVLRTLEAIETEGLSVPLAAARVGLSPSRLTHLVSAQLGAPPRVWAAWFKLRRAIGQSLFTGANLTQSAHEAGFADSAHLTRTCKNLMGVRPAMMLPQTLYVDAS